MYSIGDMGATYASLPSNIQNAGNYAFGIALDKQMTKLMEFMQGICVWPDIDGLNPRYYDYAAASLRALYYSSEDDEAVRLTILKKALSTYRYAGTVKAIEELIKNIFGDAALIPWYEYGGEAFHFKIKVPMEPSQELIKEFAEILQKVKAARSIIDGIDTKTYSYKIKAYSANGIYGIERMEEMQND